MTTRKEVTMGANGSYVKSIGGVPENNRTHLDSEMRIDGHKVLLQKEKEEQSCNVLYSNSESPIYIIGYQKEDGTVVIHSINIFEGHQLKIEVNMKYDSKGNPRPYTGKEQDIHCHYWEEKSEGNMGRKTTGLAHEPVPNKYQDLISKIAAFNKERRVYHGKSK